MPSTDEQFKNATTNLRRISDMIPISTSDVKSIKDMIPTSEISSIKEEVSGNSRTIKSNDQDQTQILNLLLKRIKSLEKIIF